MSHITAQMADFSRLLVSDRPTMLTFPPAGAHPDELVQTLQIARPTELVAVPRMYEKIEDSIKHLVRNSSSSFQSLFAIARAKGRENTKAQQSGDLSPFGFNFIRVFVLNKIRR